MLRFGFLFVWMSCLSSILCHASWTTSPPQLISTTYSFTYGSVFASCDPASGVFLATWANGNNNQYPTYSFFTPNTGWGPIDTISNSSSAIVTSNVFTSNDPVSGQFIATWTDSTTLFPTISVFTPNLGWGAIDPLSGTTAAVNTTSSFDSATGSFLVTWADTANSNYPTYSFYTPNVGWGPVATISNSSPADSVYTTFDATNNQFLAVWVDIGTGRPMYSFYNSGTWGPTASISIFASVDNDVMCSYNPITGQFIATWADINQNLYPFYSIYTNGVWSLIDTITTTSGVTDNVTISCDSTTGELLASWSNVLNGHPTYSFYTQGIGWSEPEVISTNSATGSDIFTSFNSATSKFLAVWSDRSNPSLLFDPTYSFFSIPPPDSPPPPSSFTGNVLKDRFLTQTDIIHKLVWTPPADSSSVVSYQITRNGAIIALVPASGPFSYYDHDRSAKRIDNYTIVTMNADGSRSTPLSIAL